MRCKQCKYERHCRENGLCDECERSTLRRLLEEVFRDGVDDYWSRDTAEGQVWSAAVVEVLGD